MQKQSRLNQSYIVAKIKREGEQIPDNNLQLANNILTITPQSSNIPDLIKLINPSFNQDCESKKQMFNQSLPKHLREYHKNINFDLIFKDEKTSQYIYTRLVKSTNEQNAQYITKLGGEQASKYLQILLQIQRMKTHCYQQCLINLIKILQVYDRISKKKAMDRTIMKKQQMRHQLNSTIIAQRIEDKNQENLKSIQQAQEFKRKTNNNKQQTKQIIDSKKFQQQIKQKQSQFYEQYKILRDNFQIQRADLNKKIDQLQQQKACLQTVSHKFRQQNQKIGINITLLSNQNHRVKLANEVLTKKKQDTENQKRRLRQLILDYKNKISNIEHSKQYSEKALTMQVQSLQQLLKMMISDEDQKSLYIEQTIKQLIKAKNHIIVLQQNMIKKQQEAIALKEHKNNQMLEQNQQKYSKITSQLNNLNQQLQNKKQKIFILQKTITQKQQKQKTLNYELAQSKTEVVRIKENYSNISQKQLTQISNRNNQQLNKMKKQLENSIKDAKNLQEKLIEKQKQIIKLRQHSKQFQHKSQQNSIILNRKLIQSNQQILKLRNEVSDNKKKSQTREGQLTNVKSTILDLESELQRKQNEISQLQQNIKRLTQQKRQYIILCNKIQNQLKRAEDLKQFTKIIESNKRLTIQNNTLYQQNQKYYNQNERLKKQLTINVPENIKKIKSLYIQNISKYKKKMTIFESKNIIGVQTINILNGQNANFKQILRQKNEQIQNLKIKIQNIKAQKHIISEQDRKRQLYQINPQKHNIEQQIPKQARKMSKQINSIDVESQVFTALNVSPILQSSRSKRNMLIKFIQTTFPKKVTVMKSQLKFKYDDICVNFGYYLNSQSIPFVVLFKLSNDRIMGVFSTGILTANSRQSHEAFMFSLEQLGQVYTKQPNSQQNYPARYMDNALAFGNSEFYIKNNSSQKTFKLHTHIIGTKYFNIPKQQLIIGNDYPENVISFKQMEIHRIYYR